MSLNCESYTLSYSETSKGWPSFYSFVPDFMIGMNSYFYSFKGGNIFRHNTGAARNTYYGQYSNSTITSVFNPEPTLSIKLFKTLSYEATTTVVDSNEARWECTRLLTDLTDGNPGSMLETYFEEKEGEWFSYLRTNAGTVNWKQRSANGVGVCTNVTGPNTATVVTFATPVGSLLNIGDTAYAATLNAGADGARVGNKLSNSTENFDGNIALVRAYNRVLTAAEVLQNFNAQKSRFGL